MSRAEHLVRGKTNKAERLYKKLLADGHGHYTPLLEPGFPERVRELLDGKDDGLADMTDLLDAEEGGGPAPLRRFSSGFARAAP